MAVALAQAWASATGSGTSIGVAYGSNTSAASLLVACVGSGDNGTTISSVTDTQTNTWTIHRKQTQSAAIESSISYVANAPGGADTVTANFGASAFASNIAIGEFSGVATTTPATAQNSAGGFSTAPNSGNITAVTGDLLVGTICCSV